jgi:hypothetical protein
MVDQEAHQNSIKNQSSKKSEIENSGTKPLNMDDESEFQPQTNE